MKTQSLRIKTNTKSGGTVNHNQTLQLRTETLKPLKVKTNLKAGRRGDTWGSTSNHNQRLSLRQIAR